MPLVSTSALTKRYPGGVVALESLDLSLEPGIIGLVGANGAGKSTLLRILLGLLPPTSGEATVLGHDVRTAGTTLRRFVGYMPESDCLPPDTTATDFVGQMARLSGLPAAGARERAAEVLRHVGLYEERYRPIGGYSTGMKQRVKLAQALVHDPRLLLLDEPTNGLDPAGRDEMLALVRRTGTEFGLAVIVASHLLGEIERVCDFLVAIDAGKLIHAAPLHEFTERTGTLAVEVEEGAAGLAAALAAAGVKVTVDGRTVLVTLEDERPWDLVRDTIADLDLPLVRIEQRRRRPRGAVPVTEAGGSSSSIYDLGYQGYDGPRLGRPAVALGLLGQTLRAAYGIGRGGRAKIMPFLMLGLSVLPAVLAVGITALAAQAGAGAEFEDASPIRHDTYQNLTSTLVMLFCAAQAPELFGRDQRHGVLPLYFSRVLTRVDYTLARAGGLFFAILVISVVPQLILSVGAILAAPDPLTGLREDLPDVPRYLAVSLLSSALLGGVATVIAAWTPRRAYATAAIIAVFIIPPIVVALIAGLAVGDAARLLVLVSPSDIIDGVNAAVFGTVSPNPTIVAANLPGWTYIVAAIVETLLCVVLVLRRYLGITA